MNKLKCIVVDDEPLACRLLASYIERCDKLTLLATFTSASAARDAIIAQCPDLVFLDIQMPEMSGIDLARQLPESVKVVFTTAYRDYAVEGFRVNALDYLMKPVSYEEFLEAVDRALPNNGIYDEYISVKSEYRLVRIAVRDIRYVEGLKDYIKIYVENRPHPILTLMSMKAMFATLNPRDFMRVHRSFIVNLAKIDSLEQGKLVVGASRIPVSDSCRAELLARL